MKTFWVIIFVLTTLFSFGQTTYRGVYYDVTRGQWQTAENASDNMAIPSGVYYNEEKKRWQTGGHQKAEPEYNQNAIVNVYFNSESKRVEFDTVIELPNKVKSELYNQCLKFFKLGSITKQKGILESNDGMLYSDTNEIVVSGIYKTSYRPHGNSYDYNCVYSLSIKFKDGKIKCSFFDFILYPYEIKTSSYGWFGSSGFGMGGSKAPAALNAKPVEPMFLKGQLGKGFKLFPLMNLQVAKVVGELVAFLTRPKDKDDNW